MAKKTQTAEKVPAKTRGATGSKKLVIVESPNKARTISKFLGNNYMVEASIGHIRDLPKRATETRKELKTQTKADWHKLGVNVDHNFEPIYMVPADKKKQVDKLKQLIKSADELYLATDEDREGEAISWHLCQVLNPKVPVHRLVFHEITKTAIQQALSNPRTIDQDLVYAQETRRILDRLYGYEVSELLWRKIKPSLSAGRVQSVAVRLIVERERERMKFVSSNYWDLLGLFAKPEGAQLPATLSSCDGRRVPSAKDFDSTTGKIKDPNLLLLDEAQAQQLAARLRQAEFKVTKVEESPYSEKPYAPFTTSQMTQEANRKLRFTTKHAMRVAQSLYENGHITYMRTDSTAMAEEAIQAARQLIQSEYGSEYLPASPRVHVNKVKNAQEAHEAIRPTGNFTLPENLRASLNDDEFKLYSLIWKRAVASQMADAKVRRISIHIEGDKALFQTGGKTIDFPGYLRAYVQGSDDPNAELADKETVLPPLQVGERVQPVNIDPKGHNTAPPARFTEASLIKKLEEEGIGRPSTYASIMETIQNRDYVFKKGNAMVPTWTAFAVINLLEQHLPGLVDYKFTARMEDDLDAISRGETGSAEYLKGFYFGNDQPGLKTQLAQKADEIDARSINRLEAPTPEGQTPVVVRVGRYGAFLEQDGRRASLPEGSAPDEITLEKVVELMSQAAQGEKPLGTCPETGLPIFVKSGRFGTYVQRGMPEDTEKKNASLLKGMKMEDVDLPLALRLLTLPRELGLQPETNEPIVAHNGRFGPYIKCGTESRSLPDDISLLDITLEQALHLLSQPKVTRSRFGQPKEPLRVFETPSPVTTEPVKLLEGRYGPYVTDGQTNASLPKGMAPDALTFEEALRLLAERALIAPTPRKTKKKGGKKTAKKKTAPKTAKKKTKKTTARNKTAVKKKTGKRKTAKKAKKASA